MLAHDPIDARDEVLVVADASEHFCCAGSVELTEPRPPLEVADASLGEVRARNFPTLEVLAASREAERLRSTRVEARDPRGEPLRLEQEARALSPVLELAHRVLGVQRIEKAAGTLESLVAPLSKLDIDAEVRIGEARIAGARMRDAVLRVVPGAEASP